MINSSGLAEFSDKYYKSSGYPCFWETDPSLELLWILVGGSLDKTTNTVFRYLEPDSVDSETCRLSSLTLGSVYAAGEPTLLQRYVLGYSKLLDIAIASKEGKTIDFSPDHQLID